MLFYYRKTVHYLTQGWIYLTQSHHGGCVSSGPPRSKYSKTRTILNRGNPSRRAREGAGGRRQSHHASWTLGEERKLT